MRFENTGIEGVSVPFPELEDIMDNVGLVRGGHWDYERVTYDFKFEDQHNGNIYYLRVPGVAIEGEIEKRNCVVKLGVPYIGHYYYPHGIEYDEEIPEHINNTSIERLTVLNEALATYKENSPAS